jgi:hypothetical protein
VQPLDRAGIRPASTVMHSAFHHLPLLHMG